MVIDDVRRDIATVNETVGHMVAGDVSIESVNSLIIFYKRYSDTDSFIRQCVDAMRKSGNLHREAKSLKASVGEFLSQFDNNTEILTNYDFKTMLDRHLKPYTDTYNRAKTEATTLWWKLQSISNRFDYIDERADEYGYLRAECDELEDRYRTCHKAVDESYAELRSQEAEYAALYYFDFVYLVSLMSIYGNIADSLIKFIDK